MSFDLEKYEDAIMSQDETRRINAALELAEIVPQMSQADLHRYSQQIVDLLLESLHKTDWEIRSLISNALLTIGKQDFVAKSTWFWKKLISTYTDVDAGLRSSAMDLLKELGRSEYSLEILEPLIEGLRNPDKDMRILTANTLGQIRAREVVPMVVEALDDPNSNVVYNVVECIGDIGDPRSVPRLMQLLIEHPDEWVHVATLEALGKIGDQRVVDLLLSLVGKEIVVDPLITALGKLGDSRAIPTLVTYLKDEDPDVRELAVKALVQIWEEVEYISEFTGVQYELETTRQSLKHVLTAKVKNTLLKDMNEDALPDSMREDCAILLSCVEYSKALVPLIRLLEAYPLSKKIIYAIGNYRKRAFSYLRRLLEHNDFRIRQSVGLSLQNLVRHIEGFDSQLEKALVHLSKDENPILDQIAVEALGEIRDPSTLPAFLKIFQNDPQTFGETIIGILSYFPKRRVYNLIYPKIEKANEEILPYFIKMLGYAGIHVEELKKFFKHSNPAVQEASILAVGYTGHPQGIPLLLPLVVSRQNSLTRCAAAQSLYQIIATLKEKLPKPKNVFDALFVMLNTYRNEEELAVVAQSLGQLCSFKYDEITDLNVAVIRGRLLDLLPRVANETKVALLRALHGVVDMSSFAVLREFRTYSSLEVQKRVADLYSQFDQDLRVVADVADMISHSEFSVRKNWIITAGKLCAVELTDMLVPLLADKDFRAEAFQALSMMGPEVLPRLSKWLWHEDPRIKKMSSLLLARISQNEIDRFCAVLQTPRTK